MGWLNNSVSLITGGGSGLGRALVERFIAEGAQVGVLERDSGKAQQLEQDFGERIRVTVGDVTSWDDNRSAVAATVEAFGKLDTFIGNAGVFDYFQALADTPGEKLGAAFDELFSVNVKGYLLGAKAARELAMAQAVAVDTEIAREGRRLFDHLDVVIGHGGLLVRRDAFLGQAAAFVQPAPRR